MVHYQYSGNEHDVIAGIGLVNLLWHNLTTVESILLLITSFAPIKKRSIFKFNSA
nr:hypothetical protein [Candidatus Arsenophonus triatominarum]